MPWLARFSLVFFVAGCRPTTPGEPYPGESPTPHAPQSTTRDAPDAASAGLDPPPQGAGPTLANFHAVLGPGQDIALCCDAGVGLAGTGCRRIEADSMRLCTAEDGFMMSCSDTVMSCKDGACTCGPGRKAHKSLCCASIKSSGEDTVAATGCNEFPAGDIKDCVGDGREFVVCNTVGCRTGEAPDTLDCECVYSAKVGGGTG